MSETNPLLSSQRRTNSTTGATEPRGAGNEEGIEEYIYEDEFQLSKPMKYSLITGGTVVALFVLYLFTIYLPNHFIPEATDLVDIVKIDELQVELMPLGSSIFNKESVLKSKKKPVERIIMVGDIHGHFEEFESLMKKVKYNKKKDHLLVLGDFTTKGPDSLKVLDYLVKEKASCVLGNHEYNLLQNYAQFHNLQFPDIINSDINKDVATIRNGFNDDPEYLLSKKLQPNHVQYINKCSMIKKLGDVPMYSKKIGKQIFDGISTTKFKPGYAVHAGLRWDLSLEDQIPDEILSMRALLPPFYNETTDDPTIPGSISWSKHWNKYQKMIPAEESSIVYYGHDARKGLNLKNYAKGLDSGCDRGESLLALILWTELDDVNPVTYHEKVIQEDCDDNNDN